MDGGEFVNRGAYGCVFSPPLPCKTKARTKAVRVGKIFVDPEEAKLESKNNAVMHRVDPSYRFTIRTFGECTTDVRDADPSDQIGTCSFIQENVSTQYLQLMYEHGGHDLHVVIDHPSEFPTLTFDDIIPMFVPLIEGLTTLANKKIVHGDIKPGNIMYTQKHRLVLIDYGMLTTYAKFTRDFLPHLKHTYAYYPPEMKIMYAVYNNIDVTIDMLKLSIMDNFTGWRDKQAAWEFLSEYVQQDSIRAVYLRYKGYSNATHLIQAEMPVLMRKLDTYSLGMSIMELFYSMRHNRCRDLRRCHDFIMAVVVPMIRFNINDRCTPHAAYRNMLAFKKKFN
jgi:serine/threonine protein kinase